MTPDKTAECSGKPIWREVEIIRASARSSACDEVRPEAMLFTLPDLQEEQRGVFARFLQAEALLQPVFELFFPAYFFDLPPPQELLNMAHALEAFHRATVGGQYQTDEDYEAGLKQILINAIPSDLAPDFRASLKRKMDFLHQFSLKRRLKDILRRFASSVTPFLGDRDAFIEAATEARNRLVHASKANPTTDYSKCWGFAQQLGLVLEVGILAEIGFKEEAINRIIHRGKRASLIMNNVGNGITIY
jgi:ApeA N-terminal domain 1